MIYTALTYSCTNFEPVCCSMSSFNCCFLTCIQISQEAGKVFWYSHLFKNFPQFVVIHTIKGFRVVNEAEVDVFLEFSCYFYDPEEVGSLISGSLTFLNPAWTSGSSWLKPLEEFAHDHASMWNECNCLVVWTFFGITPLCDQNENWPFPVLWPLLSPPVLLAYWVQHYNSIIS